MNNPPKGWPRISSAIYYREAGKMIAWLCEAFGFEIRLKIDGENGRIEHSELCYGEGIVMVGDERVGAAAARWGVELKSPQSLAGANSQCLMVHVDDVDSHCARARAAGAKIVDEPSDHDYGEEYWTDRSYGAVDPEGHFWWFTQRVRGE